MIINPTPTIKDQISYISGVDPGGKIATVSYWSTFSHAPPNKFGPAKVASGADITYSFDPASKFTVSEITTFKLALAMWSSVADIHFAEQPSGAASNITLHRGFDGKAFTSSSWTSGAGSAIATIQHSDIYIDTSKPYFDLSGNLDIGGNHGLQTIIHEVGHAIGLGHAGPYDGQVNPGLQQFSAYDQTRYTLMSYIDGHEKIAGKYANQYPLSPTEWGTTSDNYYRSVQSPMQYDIPAIQSLYGAAKDSVYSGKQIYGFNFYLEKMTSETKVLEEVFDFAKNKHPVLNISGQGEDITLDCSGFKENADINLIPGAFSSVAGLQKNISTSNTTYVTTAIGGEGNDRLTANSKSCILKGGEGNDEIYGNRGNDLLDGGVGADKLDGGSGNDVLQGDAGNDSLYGGLGNDSLWGGSGQDFFFYQGKDFGVDVIKDFNRGGEMDYIQSASGNFSHSTSIDGSRYLYFTGSDNPIITKNYVDQIWVADSLGWHLV